LFCRPYDKVLAILVESYRSAIDAAGTSAPGRMRHPDEFERLGEHLAAYYWRGKLDIGEDSLMVRFLLKAPDAVRGHMIDFIGRSLSDTKGEISKEILPRLQALWDWCWETLPKKGLPIVKTAQGFGSWYASGKFAPEWAVPRLALSAKSAGKLDAQHIVVERLEAIAEGWPIEVVAVLDALSRADAEGWGISHWREHGMVALDRTYRSEVPGAKKATADLVNYLGSRGYFQFGKILEAPSK
jgi:hypothetical protein